MEKYKNYKDSGIEWIGEIPEHWEVKKLKFISKIYNGQDHKSVIDDNGIYPVYGSGGIFAYANSFLFNQPSVLLGRKGTIDKPQYVKKPFWSVDTSYYTKIKEGFSTRLFYYLCTTINFEKYKYGSAIPSMTQGVLNEIKFSLPNTLYEQTQIANYLDHKTTQIDRLVDKKEQLIKLLQEERTAIINQAVTKGITQSRSSSVVTEHNQIDTELGSSSGVEMGLSDAVSEHSQSKVEMGSSSGVEMKDSGIEWLGNIPKHWTFCKVKDVTQKIGSGVTPRGGAEVYRASGIPLIRSQNVYFDGFRLENVAYITKDIHDLMINSKVLRGDVLLNITGGSIGRCYFVTDEFNEANVNQHVCIVRPNEKILTKYIYYILSSKIGQLQIDLCQTGGNREALNFEQLKRFLFGLPPIQEQKQIINFIESEEIRINTIITKTQQEISLLKEYKTALISEVVTGKVDIRNVVLN